jgi:tetratricopeptide (TPR) repeat protein
MRRTQLNPVLARWLKLAAGLALASWLLLRALPAGAQSKPPVDSALQIEELKDQIAADPTDPKLHTQLGILYVQEELYEEARQSFIAALQTAPTEPASHMNLGLVLLRMERWDEAKTFLQNYSRMTPTFADGYLRLGEAYEGNGEIDTARKIWRESSRTEGMSHEDRVKLVQRVAKSYADASDWKHVDEFLRDDPELLASAGAADLRELSGFASVQLAKAAREAKDEKQALRHYAHARRMKPLDPGVYGEPLELLLETGRVDEAAKIADEANASLAQTGAAAFFSGRIAESRGDLSGAAELYQQAVRLDPEFPGAYAKLGTVLAGLGDSVGASRALEQAVRRGQGGAAAAYNMGVVLSQKGQHREAIPHLEAAVKDDPTNKDAYRALGQAYKKIEDHARMADVYQRLIDRFGPDVRDLFQLASAQAKLDRNREASENYRMVVALDPGNAAARYNFGNALVKLENFEEAIAQFEAALQSEPDNELARFNLAFCHQKIGDYEKAVENYELAIGMKETYRSYVNLAICYKAMQDQETSDFYYAKANELKKGGR